MPGLLAITRLFRQRTGQGPAASQQRIAKSETGSIKITKK